jgi:hypothetical protein
MVMRLMPSSSETSSFSAWSIIGVAPVRTACGVKTRWKRREQIIESVKRTSENSPAIHRWGNSNHEKTSPRIGRLKFFEGFSR